MIRALSAAVLVLGGCAQPAPAEERPARLLNPDPAVREELRTIVAAALGQREVTLADDALTADGMLLLERTPRQDPLGHRVPGRELGAPDRFQLLRSGDDCVLLHAPSERRWVLVQARCEPL